MTPGHVSTSNQQYLNSQLRRAPVAQSVECWTCDWKVACSNSAMEGPCGTIYICYVPCAALVFLLRHKTEPPSQAPDFAGSLN